MFIKKVKSITLTGLALMLMITSTPIAALAKEKDIEPEITTTVNTKTVSVNEDFILTLTNSDLEDVTYVNIPENVQFVDGENATREGDIISLFGASQYQLTFTADQEGILEFNYSNKDKTVSGQETINVVEETVEKTYPEIDTDSLKDHQDSGVDVKFILESGTGGKYRTYYDWRTNQKPGNLRFSLDVKTRIGDLENLRVEIPVSGYMPSLNDPIFEHFELREDIFEIINLPEVDAASIFEDVFYSEERKAIVVTLKKTQPATITETLLFEFKFNENYIGNIPGKQVIWKDLRAEVYDDSGLLEKQESDFVLISQAIDGMRPATSSPDPTDGRVTENDVKLVGVFHNKNRQQSFLDENGINEYYVDIPKDLTLDVSQTKRFGLPTTVVEEHDTFIRYKHIFEDKKDYWHYWEYDGNQDNVYHTENLFIEGFDPVTVGETREIVIGMNYKKINGEQLNKETVYSFKKTEPAEYGIVLSDFHNTYGPRNIVYNTTTGSHLNANSPVYVGLEKWNTYNNHKNLGTEAIDGVKLELDLSDDNGEVLKIGDIYAVFDKSSNSESTPWYKVKYEIKDAMTGVTRYEETTPKEAKTVSATSNLVDKPNLESHEYIKKVTLIPMGNDGNSEESLPGRTLIGLRYFVRMWDNSIWPNGTPMDLTKSYDVKADATFYYQDINGNPKTRNHRQFKANYASGDALDASAALTSSNALGLAPGTTVKYDLLGYNEKLSISNTWKNPTLLLRIPNELELVGGTSKRRDFIDLTTNTTIPGAVITSLASEKDDQYTYYRLTTTQVAGILDSAAYFSIPLEFKVKEGTLSGTYEIPAVVVSGLDFIQARKDMNTLDLQVAEKLGFDNVTDNYSVSTRENSSFSVVEFNNYRADNVVRGNNDSLTPWTKSDYFGVEPGSTPQMKFIVNNTGNSILESFRVYNILPYVGDGRGTLGSTTFKGIDIPSGKVYYTTKDPSTLTKYSEKELSKWTQDDLDANEFTLVAPSDMSTVTAVYVDLDGRNIMPGESVEGILNFEIPNLSGQNIVNDFVYSGTVVGSGNPFNATSETVAFNTDVAQVIYEEKLPTGTASQITGMPEPLNVVVPLDNNKKASITVDGGTPELEGYTFKGWTNEQDQSVADGHVYHFDNNNPQEILTRRLMTSWTANTYTIKFNAGGGSGTMSNLSMTYDVKKELPEQAFTRNGYTFAGWATVDNGIVEYADKAEVKNLSTQDDVVLYAIWDANDYEVRFNKNDSLATGTMSNQEMVYDRVATLKTSTFEKTGYSVVGWSKSATGTVNYEQNEQVKNLGTDGIVDIHAVWAPNKYNVQFFKNDTLATGTTANQEFTYDDTAKALTENGFKKAGYTFAGWATTPTGAVVYTDKQAVTNLSDKDDVKLYAKWTAQDYSVKFNGNHASVTGTMADQIFTYDAIAKTLSENTFERIGYTFAGWSLDAAGTVKYADKESVKNITTSKTVTLYAQWDALDYVVVFDKNSPEATGSMNDQTFTYDDQEKALMENTFERVGYTFEGWATSATGDVVYSDKEAVKNVTTDAEVTLYAVWSAQDYIVKFDKNHQDATGTMTDQTFTYDDQEKALTENTFERVGYTFAGWATSASGDVVYADKEAVKNVTTDAEVTLYAVWNALEYQVIFDKNDDAATGTMLEQTLTYDTKENLSELAFENKGHTFLGWALSEDGDVVYADKAEVENLTLDATITLYAIWESDYLGQMYNIEAQDAEINISDLTKAANAGKLEEKLVEITQAKGYKVERDGTKSDMPVYVKNKIDILQTKGDKYEDIVLTLVNPEGRLVSSDDIEEANVSVKVLVNNDVKDTDGDNAHKGDTKDPHTGIKSPNSVLLSLVMVGASLVFVILLKKKRQEN